MMHSARIGVLVPFVLIMCLSNSQADGKQVAKVAAERDRDIPTVVTPPVVGPPRPSRYVRVVTPRQQQPDEGATLSQKDIEYLRARLRNHGFDIDPRTGRPLFHAPTYPEGAGNYGYLPYFGALIPYGFGHGADGAFGNGAFDRGGAFGGQGGYGAIEHAYIAGREYERHDARRRFNQEDMTLRANKILTNHDRALRTGVHLLETGEYAQAIVALTLAAQLDNGDPACRIHLAQARMAQGHYAEAGQALRRALQLQPKLVYITLDLQSHYPTAATFGEHIDALAKSATDSDDADVQFLLGFMEFQRGNFDASHTAFSAASRLRPGDKTVARFLEIVKPAGH